MAGKRKGAGGPMKKKAYEARLEPMELELNRLQRWLQHTGGRLLVLFEGRDTAGKGGVIRAIADCLNPRLCRVVALPKPNEREQGQWYFQRYVAHLPAAGEIVLFDRSWYNRAGVEKVMGFCTPEQYASFLRQAPIFERMLVEDGIHVAKYWLAVDQRIQEQRLAERAADPLKRWKLSEVDLAARMRYREYGLAREAMFRATHTRFAPWTVVNFNDQRRGRLALIRHLLDRFPDVDLPAAEIDLPPLPGKPERERYEAGIEPINP